MQTRNLLWNIRYQCVDISSFCDDTHLQQPVSCILPAFFVNCQEVSAVVSHQRKKNFHTLFFNFCIQRVVCLILVVQKNLQAALWIVKDILEAFS